MLRGEGGRVSPTHPRRAAQSSCPRAPPSSPGPVSAPQVLSYHASAAEEETRELQSLAVILPSSGTVTDCRRPRPPLPGCPLLTVPRTAQRTWRTSGGALMAASAALGLPAGLQGDAERRMMARVDLLRR